VKATDLEMKVEERRENEKQQEKTIAPHASPH
jgi:hypothetical protein